MIIRKALASTQPETIFTPVFIGAVAYTIVIRLLEIYIFATTYLYGIIDFYLSDIYGPLSISDLILISGVLWWVTSILLLAGNHKSKAAQATSVYCTILMAYTYLRGFIPLALIDVF